VTLGVVNKLAVQGDVEPLGEVWVFEYSNHDTNLMDLLVKVKLFLSVLLTVFSLSAILGAVLVRASFRKKDF